MHGYWWVHLVNWEEMLRYGGFYYCDNHKDIQIKHHLKTDTLHNGNGTTSTMDI